MATVYSTQRANNRATPVAMNKANELGGRIRCAHGVYEASSLASGDVIEMFILPDGARLLEGSLAHDALVHLQPCQLAMLHTQMQLVQP